MRDWRGNRSKLGATQRDRIEKGLRACCGKDTYALVRLVDGLLLASLIQIRIHRKREVDLSQQNSHDAEPFRIQWLSGNGLACPTVPIGCVARITFLTMQVGMHPRTSGPSSC
jgi:hypothetical protein